MYAIIEVQGEQFKVKKDDKILINRLKEQEDKTLKIEKVLFIGKDEKYFIGTPYIENAYVDCEILKNTRGKKLIVFKYRERKSSQSKKGHRQDLTEIKIKDIFFNEE